VLEGVAFNLKIILDIFDNFALSEKVTVIGGGAKSKVWMQILADIWQRPVLIPQFLEEAISLGAAVCGGVGIGTFSDFKVLKNFNKTVSEIKPRAEYKETYNNLYEIFSKTYQALVPIYYSLAKLG
jgi:xylulokinase